MKLNIWLWNKTMKDGKQITVTLHDVKRMIRAARGNRALRVDAQTFPARRFAIYNGGECVSAIQFMGGK